MSTPGQPPIGAIAAWRIDLGVAPPSSSPVSGAIPDALNPDVKSFSSVDYRGRVEATLASGIDPGRYSVTIEGITESQFRDIKALAGKQAMLCANLYLYWQDAAQIGLPPVVAVLRVTALRRRPGSWRYELLVEAREWVYDLLGGPAPQVAGTSALDRAQAIAKQMNVVCSAPGATAAGQPDPLAQCAPNNRETGRDALLRLEERMVEDAAQGTKMRGVLGMYLIHDGKLLIGPGRLDDAARDDRIKTLDAASGLLVVERHGALNASDGAAQGDLTAPQPRRDLYTATSRGRPDIKPGDVVTMTSPELDDSSGDFDVMLGPTSTSSSTSVTVYVQEVEHRQSREQGFTTVVHGIAAATDPGTQLVDRLWFPSDRTDGAASAGSGEARLARQLRKRPDRLGTEIAQVRQLYRDGDQLPAQTEKLRRGLRSDGKPHTSIRAAFTDKSDPIQGVPYASPFAWGPFGLSLPRYPGMRVVLAHRAGDADDAIDLGSLWTSDTMPHSEPGDWWLCLPAAIAKDQRASVKDDSDPPEPSGKASNDLTDGDGARVISVGKLTVRVGDDALTNAGERPAPSDPTISIELAGSSAKITIDQNGAITIHSKGNLTLESEQDIVLDGKSIAMKVGTSVAITKK